MRTIATWLTCLLVASMLSGCCCGNGLANCSNSPTPYSDGNPYEIGNGYFWGVGYYIERYGFLCRRYGCDDPMSGNSAFCGLRVEQNSAPAQDVIAPVPATPYDPKPEAPAAAPPAP